MKVTILVGNPRAASRTREVAEAAVRHLIGPDAAVTVIELADHERPPMIRIPEYLERRQEAGAVVDPFGIGG